jgi:hypothetical protein
MSLKPPNWFRYIAGMKRLSLIHRVAETPSPRTRHTELLRLCARIGYSPPIAP